MKENNIIRDKSKEFAIRIINLFKFLSQSKEFVISNQILRSGTSIGANVAESECAISKKDFTNKLYIALKECNETLYWLELLVATNYIDDKQFQSLYNDCEEVKKILVSTTKTLTMN